MDKRESHESSKFLRCAALHAATQAGRNQAGSTRDETLLPA